MGRSCTVCVHPAREEIDKTLVEGEANRRIASQYSLSEASVRRHKGDHLPAALVKGKDAGEVVHGDSLLDQVQSLQGKALAILAQAEATGDLRVAVSAIREARGNLELLAKILGLMNVRHEVEIKPVVNFTIGKGYDDQPTTAPSGANGVAAMTNED